MLLLQTGESLHATKALYTCEEYRLKSAIAVETQLTFGLCTAACLTETDLMSVAFVKQAYWKTSS